MRNVVIATLGLLAAISSPARAEDRSDEVFDDTQVRTFRITIPAPLWQEIVDAPRDDDRWRRADHLVWEGTERIDLANVGLRPHGNTRMPGHPKPSFRVKTNEYVSGQGLLGLRQWHFDFLAFDATMLREWHEYLIDNARGVMAPRYAFARVYVNGDFIGLYGVEEFWASRNVQRRYGADTGQFYRFVGGAGDNGDVEWLGEDAAYVPDMFAPRDDSLPDDPDSVRTLVRAAILDPDRAGDVLNVDAFLEMLAVDTVTEENDRYVAWWDQHVFSNNFFIVNVGGWFQPMVWDANYNYGAGGDLATQPIEFGYDQRALTRALVLGIPANRAAYRDKLRALIMGVHSTNAVQARMDAMFARILPHAMEDRYKPYTSEDMVAEFARVRQFVADRNAFLEQQLRDP